MVCLIEYFSIYSNTNVTHPRSSDALLRRDAVEFDARPRRRRGALLLVRDVAGLQSFHLGTVRRSLLGAKSIRDDLTKEKKKNKMSGLLDAKVEWKPTHWLEARMPSLEAFPRTISKDRTRSPWPRLPGGSRTSIASRSLYASNINRRCVRNVSIKRRDSLEQIWAKSIAQFLSNTYF